MAFEQRNNSVALFKNRDKEPDDNRPDYQGDATVNGKKFRISAWIKTTKDGKKWMSLSFTETER